MLTLSCVPDNVRLHVVYADHEDWKEYLLGGEAHVNKQHDALLNRTIWYNDLDKAHTFNYDNKRCKAASSVLTFTFNEGGEEHATPLLRSYYWAVREQREEPECFLVRDFFIRRWRDTKEDILVFTKGEMEKWKELQKIKTDTMKQAGMFDAREHRIVDDDESEDGGRAEDAGDAESSDMAQLGEELATLSSSSDNTASLPDYDAFLAAVAERETEDDEHEFKTTYCYYFFDKIRARVKQYCESTAYPDADVVGKIIEPVLEYGKQHLLERDMRSLMEQTEVVSSE